MKGRLLLQIQDKRKRKVNISLYSSLKFPKVPLRGAAWDLEVRALSIGGHTERINRKCNFSWKDGEGPVLLCLIQFLHLSPYYLLPFHSFITY